MKPALFALVLSSCCVATALGAGAPARPPQPASPPAFGVGMEEVFIPMADGVRLAADIWRPRAAGGAGGTRAGDKQRFPVLLEYLPYRKTEARGDRYPLYAYFVRRGFVVARVDIRGTWNSDGRLVEYEYSGRQPGDGDSVSSWLAGQPFLSVNGGMLGI